MNTEEKRQRLLDMANDDKVTVEQVLQEGVSFMRESIYHKYPQMEPKVTEAFLLMYQNLVKYVCQEVDKKYSNELPEHLIAEMVRFSVAMDQTIKTMLGIGS